MKILFAEALWDSKISDKRTSYRNLLGLIRNETGCTISSFTFNTPEELDYLFKVFGKADYDILYVASHMEKGMVMSGLNKKFSTEYVPLIKKNREFLEGRVLHLGGCSSLNEAYVDVKSLLEESELMCLSGYSIDTDTVESSAIEILYFTSLINEGLDISLKRLQSDYKQLSDITGLKVYRNAK